jgi:serine/threonine-protein kinase
MKRKPRARAPHLGRYLLLVFSISLLAFIFSTLITSRILNRVMVAEVPEITGKSVEAARGALRLKHLSMDIAEFRFDAHVPLNQIIAQDPKPGQTVKSGRMVKVIVSRGSQTVKLPAVIGLPVHEAGQQLSKKGILTGRVSQWYTDDAPKNIILDQWPAADQYIAQNSRVDLLVSAGPLPVRWVMPNLKGMTFNEVTRLFKFTGLNLQTLKRQTNDRYAANTVLEQKPAPGERVEPDQAASVLITQKSGNAENPGRYVTIRYKLPAAKSAARLKLMLKDDLGVREIHNAMERPNAEINIPATVHGDKAGVTIMLNGLVVEERAL